MVCCSSTRRFPTLVALTMLVQSFFAKPHTPFSRLQSGNLVATFGELANYVFNPLLLCSFKLAPVQLQGNVRLAKDTEYGNLEDIE